MHSTIIDNAVFFILMGQDVIFHKYGVAGEVLSFSSKIFVLCFDAVQGRSYENIFT